MGDGPAPPWLGVEVVAVLGVTRHQTVAHQRVSARQGEAVLRRVLGRDAGDLGPGRVDRHSYGAGRPGSARRAARTGCCASHLARTGWGS